MACGDSKVSEVNRLHAPADEHIICLESADAISDPGRDETLQLPKTRPPDSLIARLALHMLEEAADESNFQVAVRTPVPVVLVPAVAVVSPQVTLVSQAINFVPIDFTVARSRFQMYHHRRGCSKIPVATITFDVTRCVYFLVLVNCPRAGQHLVTHDLNEGRIEW